MARARNIKPGFFTNDVLGELPPLARLLFAGLWTICDREGRVEDRPKKIKAETLPYDDCNADELLQLLTDKGFLSRYQVGDVRVIQVVAWDKHQNPHVKEAASTLPAQEKPSASTVLEQCDEQPIPERAGLIPDSGFLIPDSKDGATVVAVLPVKKERNPKPEAIAPELLVEAGFTPEIAAEFIAHKQRLKAPLTLRAWEDHLAEAAKAGWTPLQAAEKVMAKGWKGFEARYVSGEAQPFTPKPEAGAGVAREVFRPEVITEEQKQSMAENARKVRQLIPNLRSPA